jgi:hypothetical protein
VYDNIVFQNEYGVIATSDPFPVLGDTALFDGGNHLVDNTYYVKSDSSRILKAEKCWWGEEPVDSLFRGVVDYVPWLDEQPTGIDEREEQAFTYVLGQSYPNPVLGGDVRVRFSVAKRCKVRLTVYNVLGQQVKVLHSGNVEPGWHELRWDGRNQDGKRVGPGLFFYRLETPVYEATKKMVMLR